MKQRNSGINRLIKKMMIAVSLILAVLLSIKEVSEAGRKADFRKAGEWVKDGASLGISYIWRHQYPAASWEESSGNSVQAAKHEDTIGSILCGFLFSQSPLYRYAGSSGKTETDYGEMDPAYKGYLESGKFYEEHSFLLYDGGEESGEDGSVNAGAAKAQPEQPAAGAGTETEAGTEQNQEAEAGKANTQALGKEPALTCAVSSQWPIVGTTYRKEQLADYDYLMKHFYSVHTSTTAGRDLMKSDKFLAEDFTLEGGNDKPQILIYHTHSQEEFADHGPSNPNATVVGIGSYLTDLLTAKGYNVIHDTSVYDLQNGKLDRNKAYTYALDGISGILQENPSIEVVLDIHRDGVNESLHMVNQVNGKPTAPIMFFNGVSQTPEGPIEYLPNPYREQNLAFSFQMQLDAAAYFPNLTRKIYIKGLRYNQHLRPRSALIEVGAQTNTYQEALNAMDPLAEVLDMVLQGN
ncbi:stage II sporulation protein P [Clostridium sp. Marseille-P2415]|uniref:stage II sporulation protein P n=1 Tax=Clostridium sp. Marseille-P2415 TaxID=1805471 RepID=UPI00111569E0|nr:stage II sporulation protein P [Clostridium sp. Marseille-P2415]